MKQRILFFSLVAVVLLSVVNCAKRGTPTGGLADKTPPKMVKSNRKNLPLILMKNEFAFTSMNTLR